jgi:hypothetical protein
MRKMKKQNSIPMAVVHAHAAGIDVGSRQHYVAVGQDPGDVKTFNVYTKDQEAMIEWLHQKKLLPLRWNLPELTGKRYSAVCRQQVLM